MSLQIELQDREEKKEREKKQEAQRKKEDATAKAEEEARVCVLNIDCNISEQKTYIFINCIT